jgi:hypothetical protein
MLLVGLASTQHDTSGWSQPSVSTMQFETSLSSPADFVALFVRSGAINVLSSDTSSYELIPDMD